MTFYEKLINAQNELKAPKGQFNNFGKYKYRSAEDILEAVKPVNQKNGLLLMLSDKPVMVGDRIYIEATAKITDGKESHEVTAYARESIQKKGMDDSQITGTASSYARKYALNGLYLIDDTKDADTDEYKNQNDRQQAPPQKQVSKEILLAKFKQGGGTEEQFNEWYKTQKNKGNTNNQIDDFLTKKLLEKQNKG